jgi:hypothetical protein
MTLARVLNGESWQTWEAGVDSPAGAMVTVFGRIEYIPHLFARVHTRSSCHTTSIRTGGTPCRECRTRT